MPTGERIELNPVLRPQALAETFAKTGRIHIADVLAAESARRLHQALEHETPWGLILNDGERVLEFERVSAEDYQSLAVAAWKRAQAGFQYFHHHHRLLEHERVYPEPSHYLRRLVDFLTGERFVRWLEELTGCRPLFCLSSTATLYKPLDFLTVHDDGKAHGKLFAYVLNLTPRWQPDWGGALQFYDSADHIEEGYLPTYNALNLFRVPQRHSVTQVAAFGGLRYAISGWYAIRA